MQCAEDGPIAAVPPCPSGLLNFPDDSVRVTDADEEVLELYMDLASSATSPTGTSGLGFLDGTRSVLDIELALTPPNGAPRSSSTGRRKSMPTTSSEKIISIKLQQDLGALKGRKGDTGQWGPTSEGCLSELTSRKRCLAKQVGPKLRLDLITSLHLARHVLSQHHFPPARPLLDRAKLSSARILELGAGAGLLAVLLAGLCAEYTASDRLENLRLVQRNLELNGVGRGEAGPNLAGHRVSSATSPSGSQGGRKAGAVRQDTVSTQVHLEEVDWIAVSAERRRREGQQERVGLQRSSVCNAALRSASPSRTSAPPQDPDPPDTYSYDLVLAVDCIFNEHLVRPLVDTLAYYCPRGGRTVAWVLVELRSPDVLTLFLETWLADPGGPWTIVRLGADAMGSWDGGKPRWVGWVGWR